MSQARIGIWEAKTFPGGTVCNTPGTPAYFELITREYARAVEFYRDVFGWDPHVVSDTAEFRLAAPRDGDETIAGIMDGSGFRPAGQTPRTGGSPAPPTRPERRSRSSAEPAQSARPTGCRNGRRAEEEEEEKGGEGLREGETFFA